MAPEPSTNAAAVLEDPVWEAIMRAPVMDIGTLPEHVRADIEEGMRLMEFRRGDIEKGILRFAEIGEVRCDVRGSRYPHATCVERLSLLTRQFRQIRRRSR